MYKTQKTFSPLDCGLCKCFDCKYRANYEQLYSVGFKIPISECKRLKDRKRMEKMTKGRVNGYEKILRILDC